MPAETITLIADTIDGAAEQIIHLLEGADNRRDVIYCHGWFGFGASAILKAVVERLRSSSGLTDTGRARDLGKIIHVDVSQWQSKRALQRVIAQELELPPQVMAFFDQNDEEDDFIGVEQSARGVIRDVKAAILNELMAHNFLVVLHNGSGNYIDLWEVGVPVMGQLRRRMLWTSRGRFWHHAKDGHGLDWQLDKVESAKCSDAAIYVVPSSTFEEDDFDEDQVLRNALYAEAEEVAKYTGVPESDMNPKIVIECILYRALRDNEENIDWESHGSNYWVCDGIIQEGTDGGRSAWEISDALQRNMTLDFCTKCTEAIYELQNGNKQRFINRWVSVATHNSTNVQLTSQATSFFCTTSRPSVHHYTTWVQEAGMFEHSNRMTSLRVINLSHSTFSFSSPPFLSCSNLRFLLLDHCKDQDAQYLGEENDRHHHRDYSQQNGGAWFRNLWVLELSYTDWYWLLSKDMLDLMVSLRELNLKGFSNRSMMHLHHCSGAGSNRRSLIKLRVVSDDSNNAPDNDDDDDDDDDRTRGKRNEQVSPPVVASSFFPDLSSWHILKTVVLDGCRDLELIDCNTLPLSLESFSLISSVVTASKIKRISFHGCTKLKSLLLRGLFGSLGELDMSGTTIRTLDLSATQAQGLKRLLLVGCEKLCTILWPPEKNKKIKKKWNISSKIWLEILRIDTTTTTYAAWNREEGKSNKQEAAACNSPSIIIGSSSSATVCGKEQKIIDSDSYVSIRDARLFRSLVSSSLRFRKFLHVKISSTEPGHKGTDQGINTGGGCGSAAVNAQKPGGSLYVDDIIISTYNGINSQAADANRDVFEALVMRSKWLWGCPPIPTRSDCAHCYISIPDETQMELLLQGGTATSPSIQVTRATTLPAIVNEDARTLHLHDSLSITCLPGPVPAADADLNWNALRWCRLERCPSMEGVVFSTPPLRRIGKKIFYLLETLWASQLPKVCYIWNWSTTSQFHPGSHSFENLVFLHLDYCTKLVHVLPLYTSNPNACLRLETLEIVCCGDLREVFPSDSEPQQEEEGPRGFPRLQRIHLYELPKLQHICGRRMLAPSLETVKVRGCWSLKRLPAVGHRIRGTLPVVDCEKDWWDGLEWDGESASHHPSHYKTMHSAYYKKNQLRDSVLR